MTTQILKTARYLNTDHIKTENFRRKNFRTGVFNNILSNFSLRLKGNDSEGCKKWFFYSRYLFFKEKTLSKQFKNSMYFLVVVVILNLQHNKMAEKRIFSDGKTSGRPKVWTEKFSYKKKIRKFFRPIVFVLNVCRILFGGGTCSSFLLTGTLISHFNQYTEEPEFVKKVLELLHVDDLISGSETVSDAI